MEFQVGDKVRAFGIDGFVVRDYDNGTRSPIEVLFDTGDKVWFTKDGKLYTWHKEPSLVLVKRPKKVKRTYWFVSCRFEGTERRSSFFVSG